MNDVHDVGMSGPVRRWLSAWLAALLIAFALDGAVAHWSQPVARRVKHSEVSEELKEAGHFGSVLALAAFVFVLHESRGRGAALLLGSAVTAGLFYSVVRWTVGRTTTTCPPTRAGRTSAPRTGPGPGPCSVSSTAPIPGR